MIVGDFDNDGDVDVLYQDGNTAGTGFGYFRNNGSGTYTNFANANSAGTPFTAFSFASQQLSGFHVGDSDNDGDTDIFDREAGGGLNLWRNDAGTFTLQPDPLGSFTFPSRMLVGDFDSDGDVDVLYQDGNTAGTGFGYFRNNGSGTYTNFANANSAGTPFTAFSFASQQLSGFQLADADNDGDVDIFDREAGGGLSLWEQGSNSGGNGKPPAISTTSPADNAANVFVNTNITIVFDESVVKGTGNIMIVRTSDSMVFETIPVIGPTVTGSGTTWAIDPTSNLASNTSYAVRFASGTFVDSDGAVFFGFNNNTTLNFTTGVTTAASTTVSGRVLTHDGRGIGRAQIVLSDSAGSLRKAVTNPFGYYSFGDVPAGATYIFTVSAKGYNFSQPTQVRNVTGDADDIIFVSDH
jgi:hypothetical protein